MTHGIGIARPALAITAIVVAATITSALAGTARADFTIDLGRGPVTVHEPSGYDGSPTPLVLLLHGYSASGSAQESYFGFLPILDEYGFFYLFPDGTVDGFGNRFWNATDACCDFGGLMPDDSGYLRALLDEVIAQRNVDLDRVYVMGHSNGGFMSYRMACDHADLVAAIMSLAGATFADETDCAPVAPVHVLQVHGTADTVVLYDGGTITGVPYPGAVESVETWAAYDGCTPVADTSADPIDLDRSIPGDETTITRYTDACDPGGSAELWSIAGGAHSPLLVTDFSHRIMHWFYAHPKGAIVGVATTPALADARGSIQFAPNPFRSSARFEIAMPGAGTAVVTIHDVAGRLVHRFESTASPSGLVTARWNGRTTDGRAAPAGVYVVRATSGDGASHGEVRAGRVVLVGE